MPKRHARPLLASKHGHFRYAVLAVSAVKERSPDVLERCEGLVDHVFQTGSCDLAVTAYRANADLLSTLMASARIRDRTVFLVRRAGDDGRLETLGMTSAALVDPVISLSAREREVSMTFYVRVSPMQRSAVNSSSRRAP